MLVFPNYAKNYASTIDKGLVADDGHTVKPAVARDVAEVVANSTSATVARNVARNNFKGGHTMQLSSCARCCGQCCIVCPCLKLNFFHRYSAAVRPKIVNLRSGRILASLSYSLTWVAR